MAEGYACLFLQLLGVWLEPRVTVEVMQTPARDSVIITVCLDLSFSLRFLQCKRRASGPCRQMDKGMNCLGMCPAAVLNTCSACAAGQRVPPQRVRLGGAAPPG